MKTLRITVELDIPSTDDEEFAPDPADLLQQKIEALSDLLGCTEEEAERTLFERL